MNVTHLVARQVYYKFLALGFDPIIHENSVAFRYNSDTVIINVLGERQYARGFRVYRHLENVEYTFTLFSEVLEYLNIIDWVARKWA